VERFDVVVVGAGPAGSLAAYHLARAHARVLIVDKARFSRDKPCGGGLTYRALRQLPFSVEPVVEDVVSRVECRLHYRRSFERGDRPLTVMTQRRHLDAFLAERAVEAGADFRDGTRAEVESDTRVRIGGVPIESAAIIGADGANGPTARALGLGGEIVHGVALEGNLEYGDRVTRSRYGGRMVLELAVLPGGYGWVFPKGDHVNFGVGGWGYEGPRLRDHLRRLCHEHGVAADELTDVRGHRLPLRRPGTRLARGRAALIGDAAGLVDPVSGDGMYEAFFSARLAAAATIDLLEGRGDSLEPYEAVVARALGAVAAAGWGAKVALDRFPRAVFALMRLPMTWRGLEKVVLGEVASPTATKGAERRAMKLVEALARAAGDPGRAFRAAAA
jgi:geranylgeranyl reductase family protein